MLVTRLAGSIGGDSENSVNEVLLNSDVTKTGDMNERMLQVKCSIGVTLNDLD